MVTTGKGWMLTATDLISSNGFLPWNLIEGLINLEESANKTHRVEN